MRPGRLLAVLAVVAVTGAAACRDDDGGTVVGAGDGSSTTAPSTTGPAGTDPAGPTDPSGPPSTPATTAPAPVPAGLVFQIRTGGGFVPAEYEFATVPQLSLYGDGRVVATGPTTLEYPGRALPNVLSGKVSEGDGRDLLAAAREAGVAGSPDLGQPPIADAPTTTFVLVDGGRTYRLEAYALGLEMDGSPGVTPAQREARRRLNDLVARAGRLGDAARQPYRATAVSVLVRPAGPPDPSEQPAALVVDWPLADLASGGTEQFGGRCLGFRGDEAARVLAAADQATVNARWRSGGREWSLAFRPELPDVAPCAAP